MKHALSFSERDWTPEVLKKSKYKVLFQTMKYFCTHRRKKAVIARSLCECILP